MSIKKFVSVAAAAAVIGGGALLLAPAAFATGGTAPAPWEPDPASLGSVNLFNAAGQPVTSGTFSGSGSSAGVVTAFSYAEASNNAGLAGAKAGLSWGFPNHAVNPPSTWFSTGSGTATAYPASGDPAPLNTATNPVASNPIANIAVIQGAGTNDPTAGYDHVLEVRLYTLGGAGGSNTGGYYWSSDIAYTYNSATQTGTWTEIASDTENITYSALVASPTSGPQGTSVSLTATETDESGTPVAGSYTFYNGTTAIASNVAVNGSGVATTTTSTLPFGTDNLSAVFTPTTAGDGGSSQSTGFATENVSGPATNTALSIPGPVYATDAQGSYPASLDATVTLAIGGTGVTAGSVAFFDGSTQIASVPAPGAAGGVYDTTYDFTTVGNHNITAVFTPTDPTVNAPSTSSVVTVNVLNKPHGACSNESAASPNCTDTQDIEAGVPTGTITITTPYNGTSCAGAAATTTLPNIGTTESIAAGSSPNQNSLTPSTPGCVNGVLNIGTLELTSDDREFSASTTFQDIAITDNLSANQNWTLSAQASNLHDGNYTPATSV